MRYLLDQKSYEEMLARTTHPNDCYVYGHEYLHHLYVDGVKYIVARALYDCIKRATAANDTNAIVHLRMHEEDLRTMAAEAQQRGEQVATLKLLGDPPPREDDDAQNELPVNSFFPALPMNIEETGLNRTFLSEMILRVVYNRSRVTGGELSDHLKLTYEVVEPLITDLRRIDYIDIAGQRGMGDIGYEYVLTSRGSQAALEAMQKTQYSGECPVPLTVYIDAIREQSVRNIVVTRRNVRQAFNDLILSEDILNDVGPAVNSGSSVFLFGYPGNGKTSIAERITRLMGDIIFLPYAVEVEGQIIKLFDPIVHERVSSKLATGSAPYDERWVRLKRPTVIVGGELTMRMLDLTYNETARVYEAPLQMKANGGVFLIDDFGRQQVRPQDLLNRWIVPLEKRVDYLSTVTGKKIEIPFDQLIIFSTNLDPNDLVDEAFLRRIKFKINVTDPTEAHWREIWKVMCKVRKVPYDERGINYLIDKWYKPEDRPFRMCQPRDIIDQMLSIAKYNMEKVTFNPDLIDAACETYFVNKDRQDFGAKVTL